MIRPPLSLYVHLPWCIRKCPYCDFNSHTAGDSPPRQRYIDALLEDLRAEQGRADGRALESVFLGGGTPSLFAPAEIERLLRGVDSLFVLADDVEITMEANPGTVECGDPAGYRQAGVNRLSIGAQSFDDEQLQRLGRIHGSADIRRAVESASAAGFDNVNIDLMHGLPGQDTSAALADLHAAIELDPAHISWYQLTLEPNTVFFAKPPQGMPDDEAAWDIQEQGQALLASEGYAQYEVSAYARGDRRCRHNLNYWLFGDYLAVGAGAHGKITSTGGIYRYRKPANPAQYMNVIEAGGPAIEAEKLGDAWLLFEFMLNALRLVDGFPERLFAERTGLREADLDGFMAAPRQRGLIQRDGSGRWRPTGLGRRFLNDLQAEFLPEEASGTARSAQK